MIPKEHLVSTAEAWRNLNWGQFLFPNEFIEKNIQAGDNMDGILCNNDMARCFHCHTVSLSMHNQWLVKNIGCMFSRMITEIEWLYLCHNMSLQTVHNFNLIIVFTQRKTQIKNLQVLSILYSLQ